MALLKNLSLQKFGAYFKPQSKTLEIKKTNAIITRIIQEVKDRSRKDIKKWRQAIEMAENIETPRWYAYHDLIDDLSTDGHLQSQVQVRKMATLANPYYIIDGKSGKAIDEKTKLLNTSWFSKFLSIALDSVFRGYTLLELTGTEKINFDLIPRRHVVPQKRLVLIEPSGDKGIDYTKGFENYLIEIGNPGDFGIFNNIIPQLIWKKNAQQSWAEFSEKFGMPMITATTNKSDTKEIDRIEQQLRDLGEAAQAVLPEGTTIDIKETGTKSDPYNIYDKQIERTNSEISKQILGGTMVSDNGSSRSQSEVHERTLNEKIAESDRRMIEFLVNDKLLPLLSSWGLPFSENDRFVFDRSEMIDLVQHWSIVNQALDRFEIPEEWISKTFNIPINGVKKQTAGGGAEGNFNLHLSGLASPAGVNFPLYTSQSCCEAHDYAAQGSKQWNDWLKKLSSLSNTILSKLYSQGDPEPEVIQKAILSGTVLRDALFEGWGTRRLKTVYNATDYKALAFMEYNLFHFSHARELAGLQELNQLLIDKDKLEISSFKDFKQKAGPFLNKLNEQWLKTEYNFTWAVAQNASAFHSHWSEKDTVTKFIQYQTVGDSNVRDEHAILDGRIFNIEDSEARRLYPPNGWGCRCEMVQYIGKPIEVTKGAEGIAMLEKTMGSKLKRIMLRNRGEIENVFAFDQFYMAYKEKDFAKKINSLGYADFGLQPFDKIKSGYPSIKLDNTITPDNVKELFKKDKSGNFMLFKDYLNRQIILRKNVFTAHTTGKYTNKDEIRHILFPYIQDVIQKPDEVYLRNYADKPQMRYIKIHKEMMLIIDTNIGDSSLEIKSWYRAKPLRQKDQDENHIRQGLLIQKLIKPR